MERYGVLYNIRSAHNVGSMFRTADAAGITKLFLVGVTPAPIDRFGRKRRDIAKVALGAEETVPWEHCADMDTLLATLRKSEVRIIVVEQYTKAIDYRWHVPADRTAYIFGNEVDGVPDILCEGADEVLVIPMQGTKESLNVAVAFGIVLFATGIK